LSNSELFFVVSRFKEDVSWIKDITDNYIVYNKGDEDLPGFKTRRSENLGGNQRDTFHFIHENYDNLPDLMAFVQGDPFDHCKNGMFYELIKNRSFTKLEFYPDWPDGYWETNSSWYIPAHNQALRERGSTHVCRYSSFHDYANEIFKDYDFPGILRFPPGSQFIVEKSRCLFYPREFWSYMMSIFPNDTSINGGTEAHIIERSMSLIFENRYRPNPNILRS
jgi:hypothetical protein